MQIFSVYRGHESTHQFEPDANGALDLLVGRARAGKPVPDIDLTPDFTVSRPHAQIFLRDSLLHLEDLGSTHGTLLNQCEIRNRGAQPLKRGDYVRLGETLLRIDERLEMGEPGVEIGQVLDAALSVPVLIAPDGADREAARRLALICDLPLQFARESRLEELLQTIVRCAVQVIPGASRGALVLLERGRERTTDASQLDEEGSLLPQAFFPTEGPPVVSRTLARRAIKGRESFIWRRGEEGGNIESGSIIRYQIETGMYAPLMWQGRALGAICLDNPHADGAFSHADLRLLLMLAQYAAMAVANQQVQEDLRGAWTGTLDALTSALSARDSDTQSHCYRTVELAVALARELRLPTEEVAAIARGALLHDIGKIGISDTILLKPGQLSGDERKEIERHSRMGHDMLAHIPFFADALPIVLYHHECYDGSGYPDGLCGEAIPRGARIFHIVDLYDALTQERPYKSAWSHHAAMQELQRLSGTRCDPNVVAALCNLELETFETIRNQTDFSPDIRDLLARS